MFEKITILYVEDEEIIREAMESILPQMFKKIIVAKDGQDGYEKFLEYKDDIDAVVTDINMPKLNGLEMLDLISKNNPNVPMLITSAHNDTSFLHKSIEIGVSGYVNKPIDIRKLLNIMKKNVLPIIEKKELEIQIKKHQKKELENAKFSAIGQLSSGITHEINTPLTYIKGTFEMMKYDIDDLENSELKSSLQNDSNTIMDGINRIENIISSMKEMASNNNDNKEEVNIYDSIVTALTMTYNKSKHISSVYINGEKFNINQKKSDCHFISFVQKQRIEQSWIVIINNAMDELQKSNDFSNNRLDINIRKNANKVVVVFHDNAGGIDESIIDNIFEAFKSTKDSSGMGVGLSITKKIILENNGEISAYNENNGAVFEIIL